VSANPNMKHSAAGYWTESTCREGGAEEQEAAALASPPSLFPTRTPRTVSSLSRVYAAITLRNRGPESSRLARRPQELLRIVYRRWSVQSDCWSSRAVPSAGCLALSLRGAAAQGAVGAIAASALIQDAVLNCVEVLYTGPRYTCVIYNRL
jgi:hypothetical protein